jgi:hypothetical protein
MSQAQPAPDLIPSGIGKLIQSLCGRVLKGHGATYVRHVMYGRTLSSMRSCHLCPGNTAPQSSRPPSRDPGGPSLRSRNDGRGLRQRRHLCAGTSSKKKTSCMTDPSSKENRAAIQGTVSNPNTRRFGERPLTNFRPRHPSTQGRCIRATSRHLMESMTSMAAPSPMAAPPPMRGAKSAQNKAFAKSRLRRPQLTLAPTTITVLFPGLTSVPKSSRVAHKFGM